MTINVPLWNVPNIISSDTLVKQGIDNWVIRVRGDEAEPKTETFVNEIKRLRPAKSHEENVKILDITDVPVSLREFRKLMCRLTDDSWLITITYDVKNETIKQESYSEGKYKGVYTAA